MASPCTDERRCTSPVGPRGHPGAHVAEEPPVRPRCPRREAYAKHFPIKKGLLQRQTGAVKAVDGIDFEVY
ncbi:peptide ABC transporter ATP-binding protein, partial [Streptomyces tanashiensis]